jgi:lipopolysaccharide assembly outer membrane protein LptD (OstA)
LDNSNQRYPLQAKCQALLFQRIAVVCFVLCTPFYGFSQVKDSLIITSDSIVNDTTLTSDSITFDISAHESDLDVPIEYEANDSIVLKMEEKKAYLYGKAKIIYEDKTITADFIIIDFDKKDVFASGVIDDSTLAYRGKPSFDDAGKEYEADTMRYNFESKKGISYGVLTTEQDGYIHGEKVLRDSLENIYVKNAKFTTCDLPDPHFYIKADKIKVIPKKQIVTGPANLVIADINTPLFVPFGFFPVPDKRKQGILFPTFGESQQYGFNLRNFGYYVPINDNLDAQVMGDIYFRGSWRLAFNTNYYKRYKYRGNLAFETSQFKNGEPESPIYTVAKDYKIRWAYSRDAKAKPGSSFSANVNFLTSNFSKNNTTNYEDIISTNSNSSVSYGKSLFNNKLNLSLNSNMSQNLSTGLLNMTLPQLTANLSRQILFKDFYSKNNTVKSFIQNLGISYQGTFRNELSTMDTLLVAGVSELFDRKINIAAPQLKDDFKNGVSHSIPIGTSFKALTWYTVSPSLNYTEYWYFKTTEKSWDTARDTINTDTISGFSRAYTYNTSIGLSTILYGTKNFAGDGKLKAIRHVARPNISAVWNPDFSKGSKNGYQSYIDSGNVTRNYSIYESGILGKPSAGPNASLNFGIGNNLEIKVKSAKDTANGGIKKVKIIESLNIGSGYNFLADSFHLADFYLSGNTTILNKIRINFSTTLDPYSYTFVGTDTIPTRYNQYALNDMKKLGNFTRSSISISTNLNPAAFKKKETDRVNDEELEFINNHMQNYVDFNLPWSLNLNYNFNASTPVLREKVINQSITFNGDIKLTENWKIGVSSGYDITKKNIAFTSLEFFRDLHCWQMQFKWYPIQRQMFDFGISVKSSTLKDLKLNRRRSWFDF